MRRVFSRLTDRLVAADPAFSRVRLASRAMLSLAIAGGLVAAVAALHPLPVAAYGLTVVLCFIGSMAVRDRGRAAQFVTRAYAGAAATGVALLAGFLAPRPILADIAFLSVIFVSVYIRRFGIRWFAVGMVSFLAYFIADFMRPQPSDIGWMALAVVIALLSTQLVTNHILPDDAERDFRRAMATVDRRINLVLRSLIHISHAGERPEENRRLIRRHVNQLREIVLMAEGFIPRPEKGLLAAGGPPLELASALFDLQLGVERLVRARHIELPDPQLLEAILDEKGPSLLDLPAIAGETKDGSVTTRLLAGIRDARARINHALGPAPSPVFVGPEPARKPEPEKKDKSGAQAPAAGKKATAPRISPPLQRAIQVTLACGLALGVGLLLSPTRWFWAVITAYIVFNNTRSRADTALRAVQRSAGTLAGLVAGTVAATLLHGNMAASAVAIPILFFLAFYFVQTSYGTMIFFVTIAIALLYGLLGMFSPLLLVVRLEETVAGAIAGTAVAFLVFPVHTTSGVGQALDAYLDAMSELAAAVRRRIGAEEPRADLRALSRTLDRNYSELSTAARPLAAPWNTVTRFGRVREKLLALMAASLWARSLAEGLDDHSCIEGDMRDDALALLDELDTEIANLRQAGPDIFLGPRSGIALENASPPRPLPENEDFGFALEAILDLMRLANARAGGA